MRAHPPGPRHPGAVALVVTLALLLTLSLAAPATAAASSDRLTAGQQLAGGTTLSSTSGSHRLVMQTDGNLVEYARDDRVLWQSRTNGTSGARLVMQGDGNLVRYSRTDRALWHTRTHGNPGARLIVQNDGNLVVYSRSNRPLWHTRPDPGPLPAFRATVHPLDAATLARMPYSHRAGCPVAAADLRLMRLTHIGFDGRAHAGELVVHAGATAATTRVFSAMYAARFPVERMRLVDAYGGSDAASMAANNTSAYNCRAATGSNGWSEHAYGTAIDINPVQNPYVKGATVLPDAGSAYVDRAAARPGMIRSGDVVVTAFSAEGWTWGGSYSTLKDYQHFSRSGR